VERLEYRPLVILVIGLTFGVALAVGVGYVLSRWRRTRRQAQSPQPGGQSASGLSPASPAGGVPTVDRDAAERTRRRKPKPDKGKRVRAARRGVLLMNPNAGEGKVVRFDLVEEARRRGIRPVVLHQGDDLRALAENAVAQGADVLGVAGGDGSQAEVADVARTHDVPFVCVPAGLRNHFAFDLGLDRNDVTAALDGFGEAVERRVDLAAVGGRIFVNNASVGLPDPVFRPDGAGEKQRDAELATVASAGGQAQSPVGNGLRFVGPDGLARETADLVVVSNNPYVNRQAEGAGGRPRMDTAELGVLVLRCGRPRDETALDRTGAPPDVEEWSAVTFQLHPARAQLGSAAADGGSAAEFDCAETDGAQPDAVPVDSAGGDSALLEAAPAAPVRQVPAGLDGESLQLTPPLDFRILPGALRVRLPRSAPGAARAAAGGLLRKLIRR
jgi:hypothetical protein